MRGLGKLYCGSSGHRKLIDRVCYEGNDGIKFEELSVFSIVQCVALKMNSTVPACCDTDPMSQSWMKAGRTSLFRRISCMYPSIKDMTNRSGSCVFHWGRPCRMNAGPADAVTAGLPCRPYSVLRGNKSATPPQKHAEFQALLDFDEYVRVNLSHGGIVENVRGMCNTITAKAFVPLQSYALEMPRSWASWLKQRLEAQGYSVITISLDNGTFSDVPRDRSRVVHMHRAQFSLIW